MNSQDFKNYLRPGTGKFGHETAVTSDAAFPEKDFGIVGSVEIFDCDDY